jgi:hypothetical protein
VLNESSAKEYITRVVDEMYLALQQGNDVSPGERLRFEGQAELLLMYEIISSNWLEELINLRYQYYFQQPVDDMHWQWVKQDKHFYLPFKMREAPVYRA